MKYILNMWQPKDIPEVLDEFEKIRGIDKLIFQYQKYPQPHKSLDEFIETSEYDWLIIVTNDVVVKQENLDILLKDIDTGLYDVISGVMNVDMNENKNKWNISENLDYNWIERNDNGGIRQVKFAGLPLMAIHKNVYKRFKWYIPDYHNNATDLRFCKWCAENHIDIYSNTSNEMLHLRYYGEFGFKKEPRTILSKCIE